MDRTTARAYAMKLVYEWEMGGDGGEATRIGMLEIDPGEDEAAYMDALVKGVIDSVTAIDAKISEFAIGWPIDRITRVDLSILRVGTFELMAGKVPKAVVINEAVALANEFSTEKAGSFVNGVLGNIARSVGA